MINRVILIVMDSVGIGELPDAKLYGDEGSNTLSNISKAVNGIKLPNLSSFGIGNIDNIKELTYNNNPCASFGRCMEMSKGKDTVTGHYEISGLILDKPLNTFPNGFPKDIIEEFESKIGRKVLGNCVASGTTIIKELGDEHVKTGCPIVYTSADSVFQIAAHEEVIPLESLYDMCKIARKMLTGDRLVGRVIARPFIGESGNYTRTSNRHDYALNPFGKTMMDYLKENKYDVCAVGKINDIFNGCGVTDSVHIVNNMDGVDKTINYIKQNNKGLIFTNLVDFDMLYGHRNNVIGYANALCEFDARIPEIINSMNEHDMLIITADHGCDPTTVSTDHSREYIPVIMYGKNIKKGINIGTRKCFCDIAKTILDIFKIDNSIHGESFANDILK